MSKGTDKEQDVLLMRQIAAGDRDAFQRLYESTHDKVFYYLVRFVGPDKAEDMLIETFLQVWNSSRSFQGRSKVTTWIISIARNLSLKEIQKDSRYLPYENLDQHVQSESVTDNEVELKDRNKVIREAISQLGKNHQEVLDLFFYHHMSYQEISDVMAISINTVKTRIYYAKDKLGTILQSMGITNCEI